MEINESKTNSLEIGEDKLEEATGGFIFSDTECYFEWDGSSSKEENGKYWIKCKRANCWLLVINKCCCHGRDCCKDQWHWAEKGSNRRLPGTHYHNMK